MTHSHSPGHDGSVALVTAADLQGLTRRLGLREGGVLLVHASIREFGFLAHGVETLRQALRAQIGPDATVLVPTFTGDAIDPSCWVDPALPADRCEELRNVAPLFDKRRTLPRWMGQFSNSLLLDPDAQRSDHPLASFAALGPKAAALVSEHDLEDPFGPRSPLGAALRRDAQVLLLGVDQSRNSAFYLAQCLADVPALCKNRGRFLAQVDGQRTWVQPKRLPQCSAGFPRIEDELVARGLVRVGRAGDATCRLMNMRPLVGYLEHVFRTRPRSAQCGRPDCIQCA